MRGRLLSLARDLCAPRRPLAPLDELLRRSLAAITCCDETWLVTVGPEHEEVWTALTGPGTVAEEARREAFAWKSTQEARYREMHENARDSLQAALVKSPVRTAAQLLRLYGSTPAFLEDFFAPFFAPFFARCGYPDTFRGCAADVALGAEPWTLAFAAFAVGSSIAESAGADTAIG